MQLRCVVDLGRSVIACACAWSIAAPASADDLRPYEGPRQIEAVEGGTAPQLEAVDPEADADALAGDAVGPDDDPGAADAGNDFAGGPRDWRDEPEGEVAAKRLRGGILLPAGGSVLVLGAVIIGTVDPCLRLTGNGCQAGASRRAALTMGIPGAAILAAGATLLGLGLSHRRRLQRSLAVGPELGRHGGGVVVVGRF